MGHSDGKMQLEAGFKRAVEWISQRRQDDPEAKLAMLIDDACRRFDLSPVQCDFLYRHFVELSKRKEPA